MVFILEHIVVIIPQLLAYSNLISYFDYFCFSQLFHHIVPFFLEDLEYSYYVKFEYRSNFDFSPFCLLN